MEGLSNLLKREVVALFFLTTKFLSSSSSSKRLYYFIQIIALKHKAEGTGTAENKTVSAIRGELTDDTQNLKRS